MNKLFIKSVFIVILFAISLQACRKAEPFADEDYDALFAGGNQTIFDESAGAFSSGFPELTEFQEKLHEIGDAAFEATFISAPAPLQGGLGPVFNNVSCSSCHIADGRGRPPLNNGEDLSSMLIRISIPGTDGHGGPLAVPGYGTQLQPRSVHGYDPEASVAINWEELNHTFPDGTTYSLRKPSYDITQPYMSLPGNMLSSGRVAPAVFGLGLLEAIPDADILSNEDPNDANADGISGRANRVWDAVKNTIAIGKFGWKAGAPNILQQTAGAYHDDMGVTNFIFPKEQSYGQAQDDNLQDEPEVSDSLLHLVSFYIRSLAVPAPRLFNDSEVQKGRGLFKTLNCSGCHIPSQTTGVNVTFAAVSNQHIYPYTDLLLHDMGEGLSDGRPDFLASGNEWRTPPLWGIGLMKKVNGHSFFLHDGRARNLTEAIMWHGGEAENSRIKFENLNSTDRKALIRFLEAL